jgi:hypothetical protein
MRSKRTQASPPSFVTPAVYGLDAGRARAHRAQRGRRFRDRTVTLLFTLVAITGFATIAWVGWQVYLDHTQASELDHQQGVEEMNRKHAGETIDDVIDDLGQKPVFNGPTAPVLGLAPDTTEP